MASLPATQSRGVRLVRLLLATCALRALCCDAAPPDVTCPRRVCACGRARGGGVRVRCRSVPRFRRTSVVYASVSVVSANLTTVRAGAFRQVRARRLDLSGNTFAGGLPRGAFRGLEGSLEELTLRYCRLPGVPSRSVSRLGNLTRLRLDGNVITALPAGGWRRQRRLQQLHLFDNRIATIADGAFRGLHNLTRLTLSANRLARLARGTFTGLPRLVSLDLSRNVIAHCDPGVFARLASLRWLSLDSNRLTALSAPVLRGLTRLRYLNLEGNPLARLGGASFAGMPRLRFLSLDVAGVTTLPSTAFDGLKRMRTLGLGELGRASLPDGLLASMRRLRFLSLIDSRAMFRGISPKVFAARAYFRKLSVWIDAVRDCGCAQTWIKELTAVGVYVHGNCARARLFSCKRGHIRHAGGSLVKR